MLFTFLVVTIIITITNNVIIIWYIDLNINEVDSVIGYDIGAAVGVGLLAKYYNNLPKIVNSLCLISPVGIVPDEYELQDKERLKSTFFGEMHMLINYKNKFANIEEEQYYYNNNESAYHYPMIKKAKQMVDFQINSTPGYIGAFLSTLRNFPFDNLSELYLIIGKDISTPVCVIVGKEDILLPTLAGDDFNTIISDTFEAHADKLDNMHRLDDCGHQVVFEKFDETMDIILNFYRHDTKLMSFERQRPLLHAAGAVSIK